MQPRDGDGTPRVALRAEEFAKACLRRGWTTQAARAHHLGVERTTLFRLMSGRTDPGTTFIASTLLALPECRFEDLFALCVSSSCSDSCMHARNDVEAS